MNIKKVFFEFTMYLKEQRKDDIACLALGPATEQWLNTEFYLFSRNKIGNEYGIFPEYKKKDLLVWNIKEETKHIEVKAIYSSYSENTIKNRISILRKQLKNSSSKKQYCIVIAFWNGNHPRSWPNPNEYFNKIKIIIKEKGFYSDHGVRMSRVIDEKDNYEVSWGKDKRKSRVAVAITYSQLD